MLIPDKREQNISLFKLRSFTGNRKPEVYSRSYHSLINERRWLCSTIKVVSGEKKPLINNSNLKLHNCFFNVDLGLHVSRAFMVYWCNILQWADSQVFLLNILGLKYRKHSSHVPECKTYLSWFIFIKRHSQNYRYMFSSPKQNKPCLWGWKLSDFWII